MLELDTRSPSIRVLSGIGSLLALVAGLAACRTDSAEHVPAAAQVQIGDVRWYVDYEAALCVARAQDKALWVHFGENPG